jgi:hypothetical protein
MEWIKTIIKEALEELDVDVKVSSKDEAEPVDKFKALHIPINICIDGKEPQPLQDGEKQEKAALARNEALRRDVERYLGEQFKLLAVVEEKKEVSAKIMGVSEFYRQLLEFEFEAREGIEQRTVSEDMSSGVEHS